MPGSRNGRPVLLEESFAIKIVPVVEVNFGSWIQPVNEIGAPAIGAEKMIANACLSDELGCFYWIDLFIKVGGDDLFGKHAPAI